MKIYKASEFEALKSNPFVLEAHEQWRKATEEAFKKYGDRGACILSEGIYVEVVRPRCRKPERMRLLGSPTGVQGEAVRLAGMREAAEYLRANGIEVITHYGNVD
jgi:hypothetical protein